MRRTFPGRVARKAAQRRQRCIKLSRRFITLMTVVLAVVMCASASLAAPERVDAPSQEQLESLMRLNSAFGESYQKGERFVSGEKNSVELCNFADKARSEGWNYVYGAKGQRMSTSIISSIIQSNLSDSRSPYQRTGYISETLQQTGNRATDCSGLVMNFMWWAGDNSDPVHALCPSIGSYNANAMLSAASERGTMDVMPEIPGLLVHRNGHVGIYIGNGQVIEARGVNYGVTQTELADRGWSYWSKSPWIDYEVSGIYDIAGRRVFLDNGEDIGRERWIAKFVYGDESAGSTYTPIYDENAAFGPSLPAVYDVDVQSGTDGSVIVATPELTLEDQILAVIGTLPYDPTLGYYYEHHWYLIQVDAEGNPTAVLNDPMQPVTSQTSEETGTTSSVQPAQNAQPEATSSVWSGPVLGAIEPAPSPVESAPPVVPEAAPAVAEQAGESERSDPASEAGAQVYQQDTYEEGATYGAPSFEELS